MDALNKKILLELVKNSRIPVTTLAKRVRSSREVVSYRISNLIKDGIILDFFSEINTYKLKFLSASLFVNIKSKREKEFKDFLKECNFTSWSGEFSGVWRFGVDIYGLSNEEIHEGFRKIYSLFKEDIIDYRLSIYKQKTFFYEKYLNEISFFQNKKQKEKEQDLDEKDKLILKELSKNSRIEYVDLSKKLALTIPSINHRIKKLESGGYINKYSTFLDISKLGLFQYSIFITNKNIDDKTKLLSYLSKHQNVSFIVEYIGDPFLEFGLFVKDPYDLRGILQQIEESFPDNRIIDVFLIQKEFISVGPPSCVFN